MTRKALTDHLTPGQAAAILGVTPDHLRHLINRKALSPVITPAGRLYRRADVERLAAARQVIIDSGRKRDRPTTAQVAARAA